MRIPDFISPITAFRVWRWDATGLKSLNGEPWLPGRELEAQCRIANGTNCAAHHPNELPAFKCSCGIYGTKKIEHLRRSGYTDRGITGEVFLWGRVVEHELGWRAEFGYPKSLFLTLGRLPFTFAAIQARLWGLARYGADIFLLHGGDKLPLWNQVSGYNPAGLDYLIEHRNEHYIRQQSERALKTGDRVALLGRGIAVVLLSDGKEIVARLGNGTRLRIVRNDLAFNEQNLRWEAKWNAQLLS